MAVYGLLLPLPAGRSREENPRGAIVLKPTPPESPQELYKEYILLVLPT